MNNKINNNEKLHKLRKTITNPITYDLIIVIINIIAVLFLNEGIKLLLLCIVLQLSNITRIIYNSYEEDEDDEEDE